MALTKSELLILLEQLAANDDTEAAHGVADSALLDYINDDEITAAYNAIEKWYA